MTPEPPVEAVRENNASCGRQKYPHVNLDFYEGSTMELEQKLFSGELDIVIDNYDLNPQIYHRKY